ncbi:MAG: hypothetical protein IJU35_08440 [Paludibacteraceae bacterium]|nr:hypothetical protein [Paludibacteraceae bacterium]
MKISKNLTLAMLLLSGLLFVGCGGSKDEPSGSGSSSGSGNNSGSGSSSSGDGVILYNVYSVSCLKIVAVNTSSTGDWYSELRYIWHDNISNKDYLCTNSYSFNMIGSVNSNTYSTFNGYNVKSYKYYTKDPGISVSTYYFYNDGNFVGYIYPTGGGSSSGDSGSGSSSSSTCGLCRGSGKCSLCYGSGRIGTSTFGTTCSMCKGTGKCTSCDGKGYY